MNATQADLTLTFNPEESAKALKVKMLNVSKMTAEIVAELYKAKEFYSNRGHRSDLLTDVSKLNSFKAYLDYIGLYEVKAYRWLERYIPEENKLLTYEELTEKKTQEAQEKAAKAREQMSPDERYRSMVTEFKETGVRPIGWSPAIEVRMQRSDENYKKLQEERKQAQKDREEAERLQRVKEAKEKEETPFKHKIDGAFDAALKIAADNILAKNQERRNWKEKIRLSAGGKDDAFNDAIIDYLETLENDNRRIEACNNIIKICRNISVELQRGSNHAA